MKLFDRLALFATLLAIVTLFFVAGLVHAQTPVNCAPSTPCNSITGPANTGTGDPAWNFGGKVNANFTAIYDFNILNYGALADGVTDDTNAINSTFAAARSAALYNPGYMQVTVSGPRDGTAHTYSVVGTPGYGVNATGFNAWNTAGNGLSAGRLRIRDLNLYCKNPAGGVVCLDLADSINVTTDGLVIRGDQTNPPIVGMQEANVINGHPCCIHHHFHPQVEGYFIWTAVYVMGSESTNYYDAVFGNGNTARGAIASIGFSGGTGCVNSQTYNGVVATGGSGPNATFQVKTNGSGAVSAVTIDDAGYGYLTTDSLTLSSGIGTCSSVTVTINNVVSFAMVTDGQNHWWGASNTSHWLTPTQTTDAGISFTQLNMYGGSLRSNTAALWMAATTSHHYYHTYLNSEDATKAYPCTWWYDRSTIAGAPNVNPYMDARCESNKTGGTGDIFITGPNTGPTITNPVLRIDFEKGNVTTLSSVFVPDPGTAFAANSIALPNLDLAFNTPNKFNIFPAGKAHFFQVSGKVVAQLGYQFNYPAFWAGQLCAGQFLITNATPMGCAPPAYGSIDTVGLTPAQDALAFSCARSLNQLYLGALCNIRRASDSATMDLYPDASGFANLGSFSAFCAATTCFVATAYDQSNNHANCTQATTASQPQLAIDSGLGNRLSMIFVSAGAQALSCPGATAINNIWGQHSGAPGALLIVGWRSAAAAATQGRLALKEDSGVLGWELRTGSSGAAATIEIIQEAATTNLDFISTASAGNRFASGAPFVLDVQYDNTSSCANSPVVNFQGAAVTFATSTACSPSAGPDTSTSNLIVGNAVVSAGTNAFSGNIAEFVIWTPSAAGGLNVNQLEGMRRNASWAYNMTSVTVQ